MASRSHSMDVDSFEVEELDDAPPARPTRPPAPVRGAGEAWTFKLLGFLGLWAGLAAACAPLVSWRADQLLGRLEPLGAHAGVLALGGLLLWCAGSLRRGQVALAQRDGELRDDALLLEQMATDLVQMRNAIDHMQLVSVTLQDELRAVHGHVRAAAEQPPPPPPQQDGADDAIFRLAASLDQLGARIEQRLHVQHATLQDCLEELGATLVAAHTSMQEMLGAGAPQAGGPQQPALQSPEPHPSPEPSQAPRPRQALAQQAPRNAPQAEHAYVQAEPEEPPPQGTPLGLLDQLDDEGAQALRAGRHGPALADDGIETVQLDAPLPQARGERRPAGRTWEEELQMVAPEQAHAQAEELDTRTKLHQLGALLSDERLRAALEQMRRQG